MNAPDFSRLNVMNLTNIINTPALSLKSLLCTNTGSIMTFVPNLVMNATFVATNVKENKRIMTSFNLFISKWFAIFLDFLGIVDPMHCSCLAACLHTDAQLQPACRGCPLRGGATRTTNKPKSLLKRRTWSRLWKDSRDVARTAAFGVFTVLVTSPESFHLRLLVLLFTHLVGLFVVLVTPPRSRGPLPAGRGWAQSVTV